LRERRDELARECAAAQDAIDRDYADLVNEKAALPKSAENQLIEALQEANASLVEKLSECRCGAGAS